VTKREHGRTSRIYVAASCALSALRHARNTFIPSRAKDRAVSTDSLRLPEGIEVWASRRNQRKLKINCEHEHSHRIDPVESERRIAFPMMIPREDSESDIRTTKEISHNVSNEKPRTTIPLHLAQNFITSAKQRERTTPLQIDNRTGVSPGSSQHRATHTHTHTKLYKHLYSTEQYVH
jgi:hypothetical protein